MRTSGKIEPKTGPKIEPKIEFRDIVSSIVGVHRELSAQASRAVNTSLTLRNWMIGYYIDAFELRGADRADYGDQLFVKLSGELTAAKLSNCDKRQLYRYLRLFRTYPQIVGTPSPQLPCLSLKTRAVSQSSCRTFAGGAQTASLAAEQLRMVALGASPRKFSKAAEQRRNAPCERRRCSAACGYGADWTCGFTAGYRTPLLRSESHASPDRAVLRPVMDEALMHPIRKSRRGECRRILHPIMSRNSSSSLTMPVLILARSLSLALQSTKLCMAR